jgi:hypothetical protein
VRQTDEVESARRGEELDADHRTVRGVVDDPLAVEGLLPNRLAVDEEELGRVMPGVVLDLHGLTRVIHALTMVSSVTSTTISRTWSSYRRHRISRPWPGRLTS